ncbi:MAG: hypothetical protein OXF22_08515 [Anaerolineaceae bacterium]|nr:hypothetical protein [Anaerolineaceae bacterium]
MGQTKELFPQRNPTLHEIEHAKELRNESWQTNPIIPNWVNHEEVKLDRFFTSPSTADYCWDSLRKYMELDHAKLDLYHFVDPGAGNGVFYNLMPQNRRTGIDILPGRFDFICQDYLSWQPPDWEQRYVVMGNPPFGYRAWLALSFLNHSARFADYIGFILPMAFQSDGKGSPKYRVQGAQLVHTSPLPPESFTNEQGNVVKLNALWQIWRRGVNNVPKRVSCDQWIDLFTVDTRKERRCGHERIVEADYFLQRTFYGDSTPKLVTDFSEVRYACGYGIVLKQDSEAIIELLNNTNWSKYSNLATHNCRHISMYHIRQAVIDEGFVDA